MNDLTFNNIFEYNLYYIIQSESFTKIKHYEKIITPGSFYLSP